MRSIQRRYWSLALAPVAAALVLTLSCSSRERRWPEPEVPEPHMVYLFREVTPACMGCDFCDVRYWYFEMAGDSCSYFGQWDPGQESPEPAWLAAMRSIEQCYDSADWSCPDTSWGYWSDPSLTPRADAEAEEAALWLSGSLVAPEQLYVTLQRDLATIREQFGDSVPELREVGFTPWQPSNEISIKLLPAAYNLYSQGAYHDLDSLNALFRLVEMKPRFSRWFTLTFEGRYQVNQLARIYREVESLEFANPPGAVWICVPSTVIPWLMR